MGPLFACIIKKQFENLRDGDRFFFSHRRSQEHPRPQGLPSVAKKNIKRRSLGGILCDNLEATVLDSKSIGQDVFRTVSVENQQLDCNRVKMLNGQLDLSEIFSEAVTEEGDRLTKNVTSVPNPQGKGRVAVLKTLKIMALLRGEERFVGEFYLVYNHRPTYDCDGGRRWADEESYKQSQPTR